MITKTESVRNLKKSSNRVFQMSKKVRIMKSRLWALATLSRFMSKLPAERRLGVKVHTKGNYREEVNICILVTLEYMRETDLHSSKTREVF